MAAQIAVDRQLDSGAGAGASDLESRIDQVFAAQRKNRWRISQTSAKERVAKLRRIASWVEAHSEEIREAAARDFRKPATEVDLTEIYPVLSEIRHAAKRLAKWMRPRRVAKTLATASTSSHIRYEAKGQSLILAPWNYPFNLSIVPLVSAVAAGNCVVLKPSEMTPAMSEVISRLVEDSFDRDEVAFFEGDATVAQALLRRPFDHVFFTGSPQVGKLVMEAASKHLTTVTLELGGKSPVIVDETAHIDDAATKIVWGKLINQGQTCIAPDYVLVHRSRLDALRSALIEKIEAFYGASTEARRGSPDLARIVNERHFRRLSRLLQSSVDAGAEIVFGGDMDPKDRWLEPTLVESAPNDSPLMQEEIFGPILPLVPFDRVEEALQAIHSREKPLALYIFSGDSRRAGSLLEQTSSGGACVNEVALHFLHPNLPFGGINHSGHGSSHGFYGFKAFSHERAVLKHHRFSLLKVMTPPYSAKVQKLVDLTVKYL